jgi:hypothetical protein
MNRASIMLGLGGGAVACALLAVPVVSALGDLWSARQTRADLAARIAAPPEPMRPLVAPGLAVRAPDRAAAARMLATRIRDAAGAAGVLVETVVPTAPRPGIVTLRVRLSGPEKAMIALIDGIERGTPLTRFRVWRATALTDGGVRVEGELVAAWQ